MRVDESDSVSFCRRIACITVSRVVRKRTREKVGNSHPFPNNEILRRHCFARQRVQYNDVPHSRHTMYYAHQEKKNRAWTRSPQGRDTPRVSIDSPLQRERLLVRIRGRKVNGRGAVLISFDLGVSICRRNRNQVSSQYRGKRHHRTQYSVSSQPHPAPGRRLWAFLQASFNGSFTAVPPLFTKW